MSEIKHTPGPWMVVEHNWSDTGITAGNEYICLLEIRDCDEECEVARGNRMAANARLIAAAPELLEALQDVLKIIERHMGRSTAAVEGTPIYKARAAIAKATGSQS